MIQLLQAWPTESQPTRLPRADWCAAQPGLSLLEVAMMMLIMTLALAPLVKNIGGPVSANGNAARVVGTQSKEVLLANTLVEQALSNNFNSFVCNYDGTGANFNKNNLPSNNSMAYFPSASSRCGTNGNTSMPLYYQWTVRNAGTPNGLMPTGNEYFNAVLNVYTTASGGTPLLSMPSSFFWNSNAVTTPQDKTGIVIIQDISGSMMWGQTDYNTINGAGNPIPWNAAVASPYLRYPYADMSLGYTPPGSIALPFASGGNAFNDQLDIFSANPTNDPTTPWDDRYLGKNILKAPNCQAGGAWSSANWGGSKLYGPSLDGLSNNWVYDYYNGAYRWYQPQSTIQSTLQNICNRSPDWNTMMNNNVSRIEAARGSLLNFIVSMEADPTLYQNTKLGFETFSSPNGAWGNDPSSQGYDVRVSLQGVNGNNRYDTLRRQVSWMNREGPGQINAYNGTYYTMPLRKAANMLFNDTSLNNRFILLVSDGAPNGPGDTHPQLTALATQIGNGTYPGSNGQKATIFTLGLLSTDPSVPVYLRDDLAQNTPGGQFFFAQNVGDVSPIFDQIKYQIQKTILLNKTNRYNVDFN